MGKLSALRPSKYLKSDDIDGPMRLIMREIVTEVVDQDEGKECPVLYFERAKKGLVVNQGNLLVLIDLYGDDDTAICGKPIVLHKERTSYKGKPCWGLRLKADSENSAVAAAAISPEPTKEETVLEDEPPF